MSCQSRFHVAFYRLKAQRLATHSRVPSDSVPLYIMPEVSSTVTAWPLGIVSIAYVPCVALYVPSLRTIALSAIL